MAVDMFLNLGAIKGETKDSAKVGAEEIDVLAWSWGLSQSGTTHVGGGGGAGKVNVQDLSITKWVDKSSPTLMQYISKGTHLPKAILTVRKAGDKPLEYLIVTMEDCIFTSLST
ncbi:MAG: type VI secretion system tube protein Hcp, partial [Methyloceanibacter sp.]